jgi:hypothetical protein
MRLFPLQVKTLVCGDRGTGAMCSLETILEAVTFAVSQL